MFRIEEDIAWIDTAHREINQVFGSINQPQVALVDAPAAATQAYICALWTAEEHDVEVLIMLHQPQSDKAQFYVYEKGPVPANRYAEVEDEAIQFVENMGFMMDNLGYDNMSPERQQEILQTLPPFVRDRKELLQQNAPPPADQVVELEGEAEVILPSEEMEAAVDVSSVEVSLQGGDLLGSGPSMSGSFLEAKPGDAADNADGARARKEALAKLLAAF